MRKNRITIETVHCKRCGKELATTSRSVHGNDKLKTYWGYICSNCTTPEEKTLMQEQISLGIVRK